ncbi:MAG TPA: hypothetical protein VF061_10625, partial [Gemmatimonadales bacterium]
MARVPLLEQWRASGREVAVVGLGKSGVAAALLLRDHGVPVYASDIGTGPTFDAWATKLGQAGATVHIGGHDLDRIARAALTFTGLLSLDVPALLDATPLKHTLEQLIPFEEIGRHVAEGRLIAAAVVATSALTGRSVVFHQGGTPEAVRDDKRGIDY